MTFKTIKRAFLGTIAGVAMLAAGIPVKASAEANYILSTATTGGAYYPVGVALATLTKREAGAYAKDFDVGHLLGRLQGER